MRDATIATMQRKLRIRELNPRVNTLLGHIPEDEYSAVIADAQLLTFKHGQVLFTDGEPDEMVYFPLTTIISMMALMKNGDEIEYGTIGREGMLGLQVALNAQPLRGRALCQLDGEVVGLTGSGLRKLVPSRTPQLQHLLLRYAQAMINVLAQSTACNALHSVRQRTARWLLLTRDRAGSNTFDLTHEFLSKMLGVRRVGVTEIARDLQRQGIIENLRGQISICDGDRLESTACECYGLIRDEYLRATDEHMSNEPRVLTAHSSMLE